MPASRGTKQASTGIPFAASHDISYQHKLASLADCRIGVFSAAALAAASASKQAEHASLQPRTPSPEGREGVGAVIPAARPVADGAAMDDDLSVEESRHLQDQMVQEAVQQLVVLRAEMAGIEAMLQLIKGVSLLPIESPFLASQFLQSVWHGQVGRCIKTMSRGICKQSTAALPQRWCLAAGSHSIGLVAVTLCPTPLPACKDALQICRARHSQPHRHIASSDLVRSCTALTSAPARCTSNFVPQAAPKLCTGTADSMCVTSGRQPVQCSQNEHCAACRVPIARHPGWHESALPTPQQQACQGVACQTAPTGMM